MTDNNSNNNDNDNDNDVLIRQRVREFLSNSNAKFPYIINSNEIRTLTYLLANTGQSLDSPQALDGHQKWYWVTANTVTELRLGHYLNPTAPNTWRLPPKIGNMVGLKCLCLYRCSSIPPEIAKLESLKILQLAYCDDQIDLPQVEMPALTDLIIVCGIWDKERITALLSWLSVYAPKLTKITIYQLSRDVAKLFINALLVPDISGRVNLVELGIQKCGLFEVDAETMIFDLLPLYPNIYKLYLSENEIESLKSIGETATKMKSTIITKQLKGVSLVRNPCFSNLNSSDHFAAISLLKHFKRLEWLGHSKKTIRPTTEIEYWTKINHGGRHLVDGYKKLIPENLWPNILERAYRTSNGGPYAKKRIGEEDTHDATAMFYLIREGPLFSGTHKLSATRHCSEISTNVSKKRKRENHQN
jgi:hypothetical protein